MRRSTPLPVAGVVVEPLQAGPGPSCTNKRVGVRRFDHDDRVDFPQIDPHDHFDAVHGAEVSAVVHVNDGDTGTHLTDVSGWMLRIDVFHTQADCVSKRRARREGLMRVP